MVCDLVRGELLYDDPQQLLGALDFITNSRSFRVLRLKSSFGADDATAGYRCITLLCTVKGGGDHVCEVQLHLAGLHMAKERLAGAARYQRYRQSRPKAMCLVRATQIAETLSARSEIAAYEARCAERRREAARRKEEEREAAKAKLLADRLEKKREEMTNAV